MSAGSGARSCERPGHAVWLTGWGFATPLGSSAEAFMEQLFTTNSVFQRLEKPMVRPVPAALVDDPELESTRWPSHMDRVGQLAALAARRALQDAGLEDRPDILAGCGVYLGNGSGNSEANHAAYERLFATQRIPGLTLLRCLPSAAASAVAMELGLRGPVQTYTTACASSSNALGEALRTIRHGYASCILAGGSEAPFGTGTLKAWEALRVLAPEDEVERACRPFDQSRQGMVLGEGAVFFVLEQEAAARARGARPLAVLQGYGVSNDAHHWTEPDADGQERAMRAALADAGCAATDIVAINAHGTGTPVGDRVELGSVARVFDGHAVPMSATKSLHGHLLGASGAIELAACVATLQRGAVPHTRHLQSIAPEGVGLDLVREAPRPLPRCGSLLSNSFAFGGSNACLVVAPAPDAS